jgi:hypothetical protein
MGKKAAFGQKRQQKAGKMLNCFPVKQRFYDRRASAAWGRNGAKEASE